MMTKEEFEKACQEGRTPTPSDMLKYGLMTREVCEKAMEEGTWLLYNAHPPSPICLVKITSIIYTANFNYGYEVVYVKDANGGEWPTKFRHLRPATPNDMLKYGE